MYTMYEMKDLLYEHCKIYAHKEGITDENIIDNWCDILIERAIKFYIDNNLDEPTASEDLYRECKNCETEVELTPGDGTYCSDDCKKQKIYFPNLEYSKQNHMRFVKKEIDNI